MFWIPLAVIAGIYATQQGKARTVAWVCKWCGSRHKTVTKQECPNCGGHMPEWRVPVQLEKKP